MPLYKTSASTCPPTLSAARIRSGSIKLLNIKIIRCFPLWGDEVRQKCFALVCSMALNEKVQAVAFEPAFISLSLKPSNNYRKCLICFV